MGTGNNFFSVLPYTFQYGEPFTQTGFLATYKVNDKLSIGNGLNRGWDNFDVGNPSLGYMGTLNYTRDNDDTFGLVLELQPRAESVRRQWRILGSLGADPRVHAELL